MVRVMYMTSNNYIKSYTRVQPILLNSEKEPNKRVEYSYVWF